MAGNFNISYIFQAIDKLSPVVKKINKMMAKFRRGMKKADLSLRRFSKSLNKTGTKMKEFGNKFFLKVSVPIGAAMGFIVKSAIDAQETISKFNTVFQDVRKEADLVAKNLATNFGLSSVKARELLSDTGDLLTGFGFSGKAALDLSKKVNELAVDLASFTNFSGGAEGASKALTKALLGERESVKSLGITILEKDVKARVKQLVQVKKMRFASMRQAKAFATLTMAQEQSKNAIGDFARTSGQAANVIRTFRSTLHSLSVSIGTTVIPEVTKFIVKMTKMLEKLNKTSSSTKKLIFILAGVVAILPILAILIGSLTVVFGALIKVILAVGVALKFLASNPIIIFISSLTFAVFALVRAFKELKSLNPKEIFSGIGKLATNPIKSIGEGFNVLFGRNEFGEVKDLNKELKTPSARDNLDITGNINFANVPKGTAIDLFTSGSVKADVGANMTIAGGAI